ncbi:MAG: DNA mismatch repair protein MutS [Sideroxydans sp.]|nr:DNA mismatch repair protein MutS [Sideroxydans sp.]
MKDKKEQPATPDAVLLKQAMEGVTPLPPSGRITRNPPPRRVPQPNRHASVTGIADTLSDHGAGDEPLTEFLRNGLSRMTLRKLRRGQWPLQDSLDLHGLNSDDARALLLQFLQQARQRGLRCVCVVHGKGWHTQGGEGILKVRTRHWLTQCPEVLAFCEAPQNLGGSGAVLLLLKTGL